MLIRVKKDNMIKIPNYFVKLFKIKEGDFFIVEKGKWNQILLKKGNLVEKDE